MDSQSTSRVCSSRGLVGTIFRPSQPFLTFLRLRLIPLAAVVTPATLTVTPILSLESIELQVPQPSLNNMNEDFGVHGYDSMGADIVGSNSVHKLALKSAISGVPATIASKYQNESYHIEFFGPAVKCDMANESLVDSMSTTYGIPWSEDAGGDIFLYVSWVPGGQSNFSFNSSNVLENAFPTLGYSEDEDEGLRIFVMTNDPYTDSNDTVSILWHNRTLTFAKVNVTECVLYNASYGVDYDFRYPQQTSNISSLRWLNSIGLLNAPNEALSKIGPVKSSYLALMEVFGRLLIGTTMLSGQLVNTTVRTSWQMTNIDWHNAEPTQRGLEQLFQNMTLSLLSDGKFM